MGGTPIDPPPAPRENAAMPRFILLEHTGAPDDPAGRHFDLLLEAGDACHTWRLTDIPSPGGPAVAAEALPPHRLAWLDHGQGEVSGGRGFARRIDGGTYAPALEGSLDAAALASVRVRLMGDSSIRQIDLVRGAEGWTARIEVGSGK